MIDYYKKLTADIPYSYDDSLRCFVYDVNKGVFFLVPETKQHIDIITKVLDKTKEQIEKNPNIVSPLISVNIFFEDDKIKRITLGLSGTEMGYKIKHSKEDIKKAYDASLEFIKKGDYRKSDDFKIEVNKKCVL